MDQIDQGSSAHPKEGSAFYELGERAATYRATCMTDFLPCHITTVARTGRRIVRYSSDKSLW